MNENKLNGMSFPPTCTFCETRNDTPQACPLNGLGLSPVWPLTGLGQTSLPKRKVPQMTSKCPLNDL
eukprot:462670-Amphidinium_carterae.1